MRFMALALALTSSCAYAQTQYCAVDGDTIRNTQTHERIRIIGIDTPELNTHKKNLPPEPHAIEAQRYTARILATADSCVLSYDIERKDRYGRTLAYVSCDGVDVGAELLRVGLATPFPYGRNRARQQRYAGG